MQNENTALAVTTQRDTMTALQVVTNTAQLEKLGSVFAASGFFGRVSPQTATASLMNAFLEGISPIEYKAKYHIMADGQATVKSDYIQRRFRELGGKWKFNEWTPEVCDITFVFEGQEIRGRVTLNEYRRNGVACGKDGKTLKDNWAKFPREMLKARCMSTYIRAICPNALGGLYTPEEFDDAPFAANAPAPVAPSAPVTPAAHPDANEVVEAEVVEPDFDVCPVKCSAFGKKWTECTDDILAKCAKLDAAKHPELTDGHRAAIAAECERRAEAARE